MQTHAQCATDPEDFTRADMLREQLTSKGVTLYDKV